MYMLMNSIGQEGKGHKHVCVCVRVCLRIDAHVACTGVSQCPGASETAPNSTRDLPSLGGHCNTGPAKPRWALPWGPEAVPKPECTLPQGPSTCSQPGVGPAMGPQGPCCGVATCAGGQAGKQASKWASNEGCKLHIAVADGQQPANKGGQHLQQSWAMSGNGGGNR